MTTLFDIIDDETTRYRKERGMITLTEELSRRVFRCHQCGEQVPRPVPFSTGKLFCSQSCKSEYAGCDEMYERENDDE